MRECLPWARSSRAVAWLTEQGHHVANLDGGMRAWQSAGNSPTSAPCAETTESRPDSGGGFAATGARDCDTIGKSSDVSRKHDTGR